MCAVSASAEESRVVAGRYRLRSVLGSGSMGTVWAAYDEFLHRPVAVKEVRLPPGVQVTQADELRERTLREARAIAVLSHPNVIILHDVARENGEPFVVMELLPSHSLATLMRDHGAFTTEQAAAIADAVAAALEAAHAAGITHRDVKPGNVLLAEDGRIKLTDFGIARNVSEATMTSTGMMLGSPAYIAPEVASGGEVTHAADLWGLGATLFAVLEGRPPYDVNGDPLQTVTEVVHGKVPKPKPGPLEPIIRGLMAKEPKKRLSLAEVRRRLHPLLTTPRDRLFEAALFATPVKPRDPDQLDGGDTQVIAPQPIAPPSAAASAAASADDGPALAADPGPLPFAVDGSAAPAATPSPAPAPAPAATAAPVAVAEERPGRSALAGTALTIAAVLIFLAAAAGGFTMTRLMAAQPLTPPVPASAPSVPAPPLAELVTRNGDATNLKGTTGGLFSVDVPRDWTPFVTQRAAKPLPPSTLVQYVSVDGRQTLSVERFANFFTTSKIDDYVASLQTGWPLGAFRLNEYTPTQGISDDLMLTYRTREEAPTAGSMGRTTFAHVFRRGTSLWSVRVTVPTEQEDSGRRELFDRIQPTFDPAD
ncbi:serine/threonine-protein kinase [Amycolatopsis sp. 195334CR]|uniref:serine/threonine-protein kinase n=1 Tax=Amycolatopsis sp. 195334CR TaxID=2814588 RepID=UPI001A9087A0|nr:serine/threonine-protein kinase [Amycolatopsis sp. 195334CR]MBN6036563.1 serine/threonine protein kinase [Amycolatopsis sp. 195334CR]